MRVFVLGSGSSGNALLVESSGSRVLVEAGIGPKVVASRLAELGRMLRPGELDGIVATHRHGDHYGQAAQLATAFAAPLFLHRGIPTPSARRRSTTGTSRCDEGAPEAAEGPSSRTIANDADAPSLASVAFADGQRSEREITSARGGLAFEVRRYDAGTVFHVGSLAIASVRVPHDAEQVALRIDDGGAAFGLATDVGRVTNDLVALLRGCDGALVEANHCAEMLAFSDYPDVVKHRIGGGLGHLSNGQTADLAARLVGSRLARLWLGHLSRSNNSEERALETVSSRARRIDVGVVPGSTPVAFDIRSTKAYQLGLPF